MYKLVQINVASNRGSTGKIAENIGLVAMEAGWDAYIIHSARFQGITKLRDISFCNLLSEFIHYLVSLFFDAQGRASYVTTRKIIKRIKRINPDIVHLHNIHGYYLNYRLLFKTLKELKVPVIWTLHDCWPFTGHCVYFDRVGCEKWMNQCSKCPQSNSYPRSLLDFSRRNFQNKKTAFTSIDNLTIVPVSNWLSDLVDNSFFREYPRVVIHNGIDLNVFKPTDSNLRFNLGVNDKKVILGVADGFGTRKGLEDFVQLAEMLDDNFQIILIGVTESDRCKLPSSIIALSKTSNQLELVKYYSIANVYVNPTYEDNFPTTNIEALACGTPVITYNTGGSPEAIDECTGIVVRKGNVTALFNAILEVCQKDKSAFSAACRKRATNHYDSNSRFYDYLNLYSSLLQNM